MDHIRVYRFCDTPKHWQEVFYENGGDEDWLAVVPPSLAKDWIGWLEVGSFGHCCVNTYRADENGFIYMVRDSQNYEREIVDIKNCHIPELSNCEIRIGCHA